MSEYEKTNVPNMIRDRATGAVLNTDMGAYQMLKKAREEKIKQADLANRVDRLEQEVAALKAKLHLVSGDNRD